MKSTDLRQLIRESIQEYIREIDEAGNRAALEAKMTKTQEAIDLRKKKLNMEGLDEAYHDMMDKGKMKEMTSEIKLLEKSMAKYKKMLEKMDKKDTPKMEEMKDDKVDEEIIDEANLDEYTADPNAGPELEEADLTPEESEELRKKAEANDKEYSIAEAKKKKKKKEEKEEKEELNESFLYMQKLAGLITESEYQKKKQLLNETEYAGIKKVPTSGDNYQLTIDAEKWSGQKGGGDHVIALFKNGTLYTTDGSWDWKIEPKSNEVKSLLKKYVEDNKIEKLSPDLSKFLGLNENFIKETKIPSFRIKQVLTPFGMDKPEIQADLRVGLGYVIPKKNYSDMNDIQQHMGKVTKIEGDKVFLETPKGEQQYKISDLAYISNAAS